MKLRLGISNYNLGNLYDEPSQNQVDRLTVFVRELLFENFTLKNLGFNNNNRGDIIINHTTHMSRILLKAGESNIINNMGCNLCLYTKKRQLFNPKTDFFYAQTSKFG